LVADQISDLIRQLVKDRAAAIGRSHTGTAESDGSPPSPSISDEAKDGL